jgi:hypothetical protein
VHTFKVRVFNSLDIDELTFAPASNFRKFGGGGVNAQVDYFTRSGMIELELEVVDRDSSIRVDGSVHPKAEDIFDRFIRGFDLKGSKERPFFSESLLEAEIGDF